MPYGMYLSATGAEAQNRRVEMITHNLANASTPGFKRELGVVQSRHSEAILQGLDHPSTDSLNNVGGGVMLQESMTDFSPGTFRRTGVPTDVALPDSDVFFQVQRGGERLLTRAGNFNVTNDGQLVTQQGYPVLSEGGEPIVLNPNTPFQVLNSGVIDQGGERVALGIVRPNSMGDLAREGENLFRSLAQPTAVPALERQVLSGHLEQSGVRPTLEMMDLIQANRAFDANMKMIQNHDQAIGTLLSRVLRQN